MKKRIDYKSFTPAVILSYQQGLEGTTIATQHNVAIDTIYKVLRQAGVLRRRASTNETIDQIVTLYKQGKSGSEIATSLRVNKSAVYHVLKRTKTQTRSASEAHTQSGINHCYFSKITTTAQAYILGFTMADGYNSRSKNTIRYNLSPKDRSILEFIKCELGTNYELRSYVGYVCLDLYSKQVSEDLERLGVVQNKTHQLQFPTYITSDLLSPFMLGYFDGDGCFSSSSWSLTGNRDFIEEYQRQLMKLANLKRTKLIVRHIRSPNIVTLNYSGNKQLRRIYDVLYQDTPFFLKRKRAKIEIELRRTGRL